MPSLSVYLPYYQECVIINPEMIKEPSGEQRLYLLDIPHAANAGYAGLQCVCARCATRTENI